MFETEKFSLIAGNLFLDFVNTRKVRDGSPFETIVDLADFLSWTIAVGLLEIEPARELFERWNGKPKTEEFMRQTIKFRNLLRETAENAASGREIPATAISAINEKLKKQSGYTEIEKVSDGFEKRFRLELDDPSKLWQPIAGAAADFLCYAAPELLKKCESAACVLYFYDTTKNHRRRWCSMNACGNKAKAAAFYQRKKQRLESD